MCVVRKENRCEAKTVFLCFVSAFFINSLPGEGFLEDVNLRLSASGAHSVTDVVCQTTSAANANAHGTDLLLLLLLDESADVGLAREHLDA